jgi:signal peptidase
MEPALAVGSIEVTKPLQTNEDIEVGDIVTFRSPSDADVVISHRVIAIADNGFITKGDANRIPDEFVVQRQNVLGKVVFHIPYFGYLVWAMKTPLGLFLLLIPAILLIALSVINLRDVEKDSLG